MSHERNPKKSLGQIRLSEPADTNIISADTYIDMSGTFVNGCACHFKIVDNKLVYTGSNNTKFLVNGTSELRVDKACMMTYGFHINGILVESGQTPHDFPASARTSTVAITTIAILNHGDVLNARIKSDTDNTVATIQTLNITLLEA